MSRSFLLRAVLLAAAVHGLVFMAVVFIVPGTEQMYHVELAFWGRILRSSEFDPSGMHREVLADHPVVALSSRLDRRDIFWAAGMVSDKPLFTDSAGSPHAGEPQKFLGPRLTVDDRDAPPVARDKELPRMTSPDPFKRI